MIRPSKIIYIAGSTSITVNILMIAPLAIRLQREPIISILEISPTPNVAAKNESALTITDFMLVERAMSVASFLSCPDFLSLRYLVVMRIA